MSLTCFSRASPCARRAVFNHLVSNASSGSKRLSSTNGDKLKAPGPLAPLPPHKMRALVNLYHKADTFITRETLDKAIDDAFLIEDAYFNTSKREYDQQTLAREIAHRRPLPRDVLPGESRGRSLTSSLSRMRVGWSEESGSDREEKLAAALFGTMEGTPKPGYEMLLEKEQDIWRDLRGEERPMEALRADVEEGEGEARADVDELRDTTWMDAPQRA